MSQITLFDTPYTLRPADAGTLANDEDAVLIYAHRATRRDTETGQDTDLPNLHHIGVCRKCYHSSGVLTPDGVLAAMATARALCPRICPHTVCSLTVKEF